MGKSNEIFKPPSYSADIYNWYRNALNRDPDLDGLAFWDKLHKDAGPEATWDAFCYVSASLGYPIAMSREEASQPAAVGNNVTMVDEWFKNLGIVGDMQPYMLMMSNGMPIPDVFAQLCADYGISGKDWMETARLK